MAEIPHEEPQQEIPQYRPYKAFKNPCNEIVLGDPLEGTEFKNFSYRVVNQTESYLGLNRVPRYLEGEVFVTWSVTKENGHGFQGVDDRIDTWSGINLESDFEQLNFIRQRLGLPPVKHPRMLKRK